MDACPAEFPLSWLNEKLGLDEIFAKEALAVLERLSALLPIDARPTYTVASSAGALVNYWLVNRKLAGYERGRPIEDFASLTVVSFWDNPERAIANLESMVTIQRGELLNLMAQESITIPIFLRKSFDSQTRANLIEASFWNERELEALCCGVPPKIYCDRDDLAPEVDRAAARSSVSAAIKSGSLHATRNPDAGPGNALYGGIWRIEPALAVRWALTNPTPFPRFPEWLVSSKLKDIYILQDVERVAAGRYTLDQAIELLCANGGERPEHLLAKLTDAAFSGALPTYAPGAHARYTYSPTVHVRPYYEEAYWNDLNSWLSKNEPRLQFSFPQAPGQSLFASTDPSSAKSKLEWLSDAGNAPARMDDPDYKAKYERAWVLYEELDEWKGMKHGGDPLRAIAIKERLNAINDELARLNGTDSKESPGTGLSPPPPAAAGSAPPMSAPEADVQSPKGKILPNYLTQPARIREWLIANGYNPKNLPARRNGVAGVKAKARAALKDDPLFKGTVKPFDTAWQQLRADGEVVEAGKEQAE